MADDTTKAPAGTQTGAQNQDPASLPSLNIIGQYVRDLSFENPEAPASIMGAATSPAFNVGINVAVKKQTEEVYAVELTLTAKAEREDKVLFNVELIYGGLFKILNFPENQMAPALMIECPRLIFPFARQVLANVTQAGGFPPLLMEPVDFTGIYRQNLARMAEAAKQTDTDGANSDASPADKGDDKKSSGSKSKSSRARKTKSGKTVN